MKVAIPRQATHAWDVFKAQESVHPFIFTGLIHLTLLVLMLGWQTHSAPKFHTPDYVKARLVQLNVQQDQSKKKSSTKKKIQKKIKPKAKPKTKPKSKAKAKPKAKVKVKAKTGSKAKATKTKAKKK